MARLLLCLGLLLLGGCYERYALRDDPATCRGCGPGGIPVGPQPPQAVPHAPPPALPEPTVACQSGLVYVPGHWTWESEWIWSFGSCRPGLDGHVYVPPVYADGVYMGGYWTGSAQPATRPIFPTYQRWEHEPGTYMHHDPAWWGYYYHRYGTYGSVRASVRVDRVPLGPPAP